MNKFNFKKIIKQFIYPGVIVLIIFIMALSAFFTIKFLTTNINAAFTINEEAVELELVRIDLGTYERIAKKLEIPFPYPSSTESTSPSQKEQQ